MYRDLIQLRLNKRKNTKGLTGSGISVIYEHHDDRVIVFHRWHSGGIGDNVLVVVNLSAEKRVDVLVPMPQAGKWNVQFNSDWKGYSEDFGDYSSEPFIECQFVGQVVPLDIAPYSAQILVLT